MRPLQAVCQGLSEGGDQPAGYRQVRRRQRRHAEKDRLRRRCAGIPEREALRARVAAGQKNPYTGKFFKPAVEYNGPRSAKGLVEFATANLPSLVVPVADKTLAAFKADKTPGADQSLPKALLFTKKEETTPLLKSLSVALKGRMLIGEAKDHAKKTVEQFGVSEFPTLVVLPAGSDGSAASAIKYDGEMKPAALSAFLETHALEKPVASPSDGKDAGKGGGGADADAYDANLYDITKENVGTLVEGERDAWVLLFPGKDSSELPDGGLEALGQQLFGQVKVGRAPAELASKFGVQDLASGPTLAVWPFRKPAVKRKASTFPSTEEGLAAAKKAALETLPDEYVTQVNSATADRWMSEALMTTEAKAFAILFSDKPVVPPLLRALSLAFDGKLGIGMAQASDKGMAERFQVQKAPAFFVMFPDDSKVDEKTGQAPLAGMKFEPRMHGKFNYVNLANFLGGVHGMRLEQLGKGGGPGGGPGGGDGGAGGDGDGAPRKPKEVGPPPELSASNFEAECVSKGGLCGIAMLDGAAANAEAKASALEMLTKLRAKKAGGPISFSWIDATCHTAFSAAFELSEVDLPTMIYLSPAKLRWARAVGAFDVETLGAFGNRVAAGRQATNELSAMPTLEDVDCATVPRGGEAVEEEDGADDIMAEILEEERRAREEREAELKAELGAAAAAADKPAKKKSEMSKLEKLEADIEECEAMDLLCAARREKQLKAFNKEKELQEKLKKIAKKKKKAKKKAKA